jgi:hypothetical protein
MKKLKWLFLLGLLTLLPIESKAITAPQIYSPCLQSSRNSSAQVTYTCIASNVAAGDTIILAFGSGSGAPTFNTQTETFTCPGGSQITVGANTFQMCKVVLASNHATFTLKVTNSSQIEGMFMMPVKGLGAEDTGARVAVNATTGSMTTVATNEWAVYACFGYGNDASPLNSNWSGLWTRAQTTGSQELIATAGYQVISAASTFTVGCNYTNQISNTVVGMAFAQSSPPTSSVYIKQWCTQLQSNSNVGEACNLYNVTSGNKVVWSGLGIANSTITSFDCQASSTCTCPAGTAAVYTGAPASNAFELRICYADLASNFGTYQAGITAGAPGSFNTHQVFGVEVVGLTSGVDTASEAGCTATSCVYTTTNANEWTYGFMTGNISANPLVPSASLIMAASGMSPNYTDASQSMAVAQITTGTSGTLSYTQTGNNAPMISVMSFGPLASSSKRKGQVF